VWTAEAVLVCVLTLLGRSSASFPPIEFVDVRPADVSVHAEAFVRIGEPRIYLITSAEHFKRAKRSPYKCGEIQSLRKLASVLIHEEWHIRRGADEAGAYAAQLTTLASLSAGPGNPLYAEVTRAMRQALARQAVTRLAMIP
jgi:hypothetical protein